MKRVMEILTSLFHLTNKLKLILNKNSESK